MFRGAFEEFLTGKIVSRPSEERGPERAEEASDH